MDEEELQKRFTDCVYFLASPLTCKKGIECEYRHSEIARLNPRDCWYWLGGCCFNPECAFRHPPLEGLKEAYHESSNPNNPPALPVNKTNIPCYFYSSGFCNKGDTCLFLHGPNDGNLAWKPSKATSTVNDNVPCENKLSAGSNTGSAPVESHPDPSETAQIESKPSQPSQQLASRSAIRSETPDISATRCQENAFRSEFVQSESDVFNDQSSDGYVQREGWLESPPGFDVLVESDSEDADYFSVHDDEGDVHYAEYDPELRNPLREDVYDRLDNKQARDYVGKVSGQSRESIFYRLSFQKRKEVFNSQRGPDLREHLKKRKVVDDCFPKGSGSPRLLDHRIRRNPRRHGSRGGEVDFDHRGRFRKGKRPGKPFLQQKRKSQEESGVFTGPKTLDQIKEEKKKALQNKGSFNRTESDGFQGPRALSEILKNKRKQLENVV